MTREEVEKIGKGAEVWAVISMRGGPKHKQKVKLLVFYDNFAIVRRVEGDPHSIGVPYTDIFDSP